MLSNSKTNVKCNSQLERLLLLVINNMVSYSEIIRDIHPAEGWDFKVELYRTVGDQPASTVPPVKAVQND